VLEQLARDLADGDDEPAQPKRPSPSKAVPEQPMVLADRETAPAVAWLVVKALEEERNDSTSTGSCPKAASAGEWILGDTIGEGSFGVVKAAVGKHTGQKVAVKILKDRSGDLVDFLRELSIVSNLCHANIVRVLAVAVRPQKSLVFAWAGPTLHEALEQQAVGKGNWVAVASQLLCGLGYIHQKFVVHTDLKPRNLCWQLGRLTILDFGNSIISIPGFRSCYDLQQITKTGLPYGSLNYRSPEVLLGDPNWERPMDVWAAGLVLAEVWSGTKRPFVKADSAVGCLMSIFTIFGSPSPEDLPYFMQLPLFSPQFPKILPPPLGEVFGELVPCDFADLFRGLAVLNPSKRWPAEACYQRVVKVASDMPSVSVFEAASAAPSVAPAASAAPSVAPAAAAADAAKSLSQADSDSRSAHAASGYLTLELVRRGGVSRFLGDRGPFALREGFLPADLRDWLEEGISDAGWSLDRKRGSKPDRWIEFNTKLEIVGHLASLERRPGLTLNGKVAEQPLPARIVAFALAFKAANVFAITGLDRRIKECISASKKAGARLGTNSGDFLKSDAYSWAWDLGALQVMVSNDREDPKHHDGGASFLHAGVTLRGERMLR
jgi:serine/threonine protein kinase